MRRFFFGPWFLFGFCLMPVRCSEESSILRPIESGFHPAAAIFLSEDTNPKLGGLRLGVRQLLADDNTEPADGLLSEPGWHTRVRHYP
jgi:hypothetical protein